VAVTHLDLFSETAMKAKAFLAIGPLVAAFGSSSSHAQDRQVRVDTLANGRVVVSNPDLAASGQGDALELVEELRIGSVFGANPDAPELFGQVISVALDEDGNTYVADFQSREIRMFNHNGDFLRTIGRRGEGPGEFRMLAGILWDRGSRVLWAVDVGGRRFNAFDRSGTVLGTLPYGRDTYNAQLPWTGYADLHGFIYYSEPRNFDMLLKGRTSPDGDLRIVDSLAVPSRGMETYSVGLEIRMVPMQPENYHAVGPDGGVWVSTSSEFQLHKVGFDGDTVRTVELRRPNRSLSRSERDSIAEVNDLPVRRIPQWRPVIGQHLVGPDGWLWVPVEGDSTWELFDDFGFHRGRVKSPVPFESSSHIVLGEHTITGVTTDEMGLVGNVRRRCRRRAGHDRLDVARRLQQCHGHSGARQATRKVGGSLQLA